MIVPSHSAMNFITFFQFTISTSFTYLTLRQFGPLVFISLHRLKECEMCAEYFPSPGPPENVFIRGLREQQTNLTWLGPVSGTKIKP